MKRILSLLLSFTFVFANAQTEEEKLTTALGISPGIGE
jgi:hypothetical protein